MIDAGWRILEVSWDGWGRCRTGIEKWNREEKIVMLLSLGRVVSFDFIVTF